MKNKKLVALTRQSNDKKTYVDPQSVTNVDEADDGGAVVYTAGTARRVKENVTAVLKLLSCVHGK